MGMAGVRAVLLDLDGTVYEGGRPIPGAAPQKSPGVSAFPRRR